MEGFKCKTKLPIAMDPSRLRSKVLTDSSFATLSHSTSGCPIRSTMVESLLLKHQDLLNKSRTLETSFTTTSYFNKSKRDNLIYADAPPPKKVKKVETTRNIPKDLESVRKPKVKKFDSYFIDDKASDIADPNSFEEDTIFSEERYDNVFEKMEIDEIWESDFGPNNGYFEVKRGNLSEKSQLVGLFNAAMIEVPNFKKKNLDYRRNLIMNLEPYQDSDPEFILKLSLYGRKHLNMRTASNFVLAYAATHERFKDFLPKYYSAIVVLPSDWIEIAELALTFCNEGNLVFPSSLRRVMATKFGDFDKYQLAKYNKDKSAGRKKKIKKQLETAEKENQGAGNTNNANTSGNKEQQKSDSMANDKDKRSTNKRDEEFDVPRFTIKQLIRKLHINKPVDNVMALIGKKYPETMEAFFQSRLPGLFEEERAGKRMKLPVPETWETQVSLKGNKAKVWEDLIDHKKLPFMAMLRNLKNLILANISEKHHNFVIDRLTNENSVINSKQFPFRFFSAYSVLDNLLSQKKHLLGKMTKKMKVSKKIQRQNKKIISLKAMDALIKKYKSALDKAVKISTTYNIPPMPGRTLIFCDLSDQVTNDKKCTTARGLGSSRTVGEMIVLLSLMCKHSCEESRLIVCGFKSYEEVELNHSDSILENMTSVLDLAGILNYDSDGQDKFPYVEKFGNDLVLNREKIDRWVVIGGGSDDLTSALSKKLKEFKVLVNDSMQAFHVNLSSPINRCPDDCDDTFLRSSGKKHGFRCIFGFSEQVLRYMAEEGSAGQETFIENIDKFYKLETPKHLSKWKEFVNNKNNFEFNDEESVVEEPRWSNCRIFISSTFLDMFSERDLLVKYIFQELKARAKSLRVNIFEVDLRWGISEEQSQNNETVRLCLSEVAKCQFFVGILGERYGWCPDDYGDLDQQLGLDWIKKHPKGASLTELEVYQCFKTPDRKRRSFFYLRDSEFLDEVPKKYKDLFADSNQQRLKALKKFVINSGAEVYQNYPCQWGGVDNDGKARVVNLEEFGKRVLDNLWNALQNYYDKPVQIDGGNLQSPDDIENELHLSYADFLTSRFLGRENLVNSILDLLHRHKRGLFLLTGKPGSGKSSLMTSVHKRWKESSGDRKVVIHCVGASPSSENVIRMIYRLCREIDAEMSPNVSLEMASYETSCKIFQNCLERTSCRLKSSGSSLHVFIDGADYFSDEHQARLMSWLPLDIPENIMFVVSTNENSESHIALKKRPSLVGSFDVGVLNLQDRQAVIRNTLKSYSKSLDETAFNNQMKLITSKKESSLPLYLSLVCEEIRQFGDFDKVSEKLSSLPPTVSKLMQDLMEGLEKAHGEDFVRTALSCLVCSKNGLKDYELLEIVSRAMILGSWTNIEKVKDVCDVREVLGSPSSLLFFLRAAQCLLGPNSSQQLNGLESSSSSSEAILTIVHRDVIDAIRHRYLNSIEGKKYEKFVHLLLASYFYCTMDPDKDKNWKPVDKRILSSLTHHLAQSCDYETLSIVLTDLCFIQYNFRLNQSRGLLGAYQVPCPSNITLKKDYDFFIGSSKKFKDYQCFVFKNSHILSKYPQLTFQQSLLEADTSYVWQDSEELLAERDLKGVPPYFRWLNEYHFNDHCTQTTEAERSTCLALSLDDRLLAVGFLNAAIKIHSTDDYKVTMTLIGHSGSITSLCFVSGVRLCSASEDETLSLWDVIGGYRLAVMEGHKRSVTSCISDNIGRIIVSVGLDTVINVWHGVTGVLEATMPRDIRPINCVSIHPEGQLVVTGGWDNDLKIWDLIQKQRKAKLKGHKGSIKEVKFNRSGVHIASLDILGEVYIWSAQHGCMVGFIKNQPSPTTGISYCPLSGDFLTSSGDGTIRVLSGTMGRCTNIFGDSGSAHATCLTFDPCPVTLMPDVVVGYHSGLVRMYSCTTGNQVWESAIQQGPPVAIICIYFHCTGDGKKFIIAGRADGTCKVLAADNGKTLADLIGHSDFVSCIESTDEYLMTAGDQVINVHKWEDILKQNIITPHKPDFTQVGHQDLVTGLSIKKNSQDMLASVGRDRMIIFWKITTPLTFFKKIENAHMDWITCCSWSNPNNYLVTGSNDFLVKIWDGYNGTIKYTLSGHEAMVTGVSFKHGCIVSSSSDGFLKVWSHKGVYLSSLVAPHSKCNSCDLFISLYDSEDDDKMVYKSWHDEAMAEKVKSKKSEQKSKFKVIAAATCYDDGTTRIWNPTLADEKHLLIGHKNEVKAIATGRSGLVCTVSSDGFLKAWKIPATQKSFENLTKHGATSSISCLVISPDNRFICAGTSGGMVNLWLCSEVQELPDALSRPNLNVQVSIDQIKCIHFVSPSTLVVASEDLHLSVWQLQCKRDDIVISCLKSIMCNQLVTSITSLTHDGSSLLLTFHYDGSIQLWRIVVEKMNIILEDTLHLKGVQLSGFHVVVGACKVRSYLCGVQEFRCYEFEVVEKDSNLKIMLEPKFTDSEVFTTFTGLASGNDLYCTDLKGHLYIANAMELENGEKGFLIDCDFRIHCSSITGITLHKDLIFTCSSDGSLKVFDLNGYKVIGQFSTPFQLTSMVKFKVEQASPNTHSFLCGTHSGLVIYVEWINTIRRC